MPIKTALLSVSDKSNLVRFARGLADLGVTILSSGGTAKALAAEGIPVETVESYTGSPEVMDGRVKDLRGRRWQSSDSACDLCLAVMHYGQHRQSAQPAQPHI